MTWENHLPDAEKSCLQRLPAGVAVSRSNYPQMEEP